ncbi:CBS domain-containing protein [Mycolicibacterium sp. BiH015]|uniref:CBS domain-containing protein n=1 Tax=Mycolicibacterium sp. BiH015 TaxID=3018808 RepID=UPI0022E5A1B7|nr:CBS domain-containing protein [Mycolicibacterium sp. BiH015]MDA2890179.1 CBS domain-containing protein [Mycolicibacterium sp. BiH015]
MTLREGTPTVRAGDVMIHPVVSVRSPTPLREAGTVLADYGYAGLPVVNGSGCLLGSLTAGDVLRGGTAGEATANTAMTAPAVAVGAQKVLDGYTGKRR